MVPCWNSSNRCRQVPEAFPTWEEYEQHLAGGEKRVDLLMLPSAGLV